MIANPKWFKQRKYGGWGAHPVTWQGWVYIVLVMAPFVGFHLFFNGSDKVRLWFTLIWLLFLLVDVFSVMIRLGKEDERDEKIEAMAERNTAWFMMLVLVAGILYEMFNSALKQRFEVNGFLVVALFGGVVVKSVSNYILRRRGL